MFYLAVGYNNQQEKFIRDNMKPKELDIKLGHWDLYIYFYATKDITYCAEFPNRPWLYLAAALAGLAIESTEEGKLFLNGESHAIKHLRWVLGYELEDYV